RALPDECVELQLVGLQVAAQVRGRTSEDRRTDRLVRLLRALRAGLVMARVLERVRRPELARDHILRLAERAFGDVQRVGAHIRNEADRRIPERYTFIELLRDDHRAAYREAELARRLLLQRGRREWRSGVAR